MVDKYKLGWQLSCKDGDYDERDYQEEEGEDEGKNNAKKQLKMVKIHERITQRSCYICNL